MNTRSMAVDLSVFRLLLLAFLLPHASYFAVAYLNASNDPEALATRSYFYVGGEYVTDGTGMHFFKNQMYVEKLVPQGGAKQAEPVVFVHGQAQTGTNWLNTPDGRKGWASWFLQKRYTVYIVDQPQRGRSPYMPGDGSLATYSAEFISKLFTAVQFSNLWPQARLHTQWPGVTVQTANQRSGAALLDLIGPAVIITHSQGGPLGFLIADARPSKVRALISLEPQGPPFEDRVVTDSRAITRPWGITSIPITYNPRVVNPAVDLKRTSVQPEGPSLSDCILQVSPAKQLPNLARLPHLIVTTQASFHAVYDYCTVRYLQEAGVPVDFLDLPKARIYGNAHFMFLEKNNLVIAAEVERWMKSKLYASTNVSWA